MPISSVCRICFSEGVKDFEGRTIDSEFRQVVLTKFCSHKKSRNYTTWNSGQFLISQRTISLAIPIQQRPEDVPSVRALHRRHFLRRATCDDASTVRATFGSEVDDVVSALDHIEVVFNHDDGVANANQTL